MHESFRNHAEITIIGWPQDVCSTNLFPYFLHKLHKGMISCGKPYQLSQCFKEFSIAKICIWTKESILDILNYIDCIEHATRKKRPLEFSPLSFKLIKSRHCKGTPYFWMIFGPHASMALSKKTSLSFPSIPYQVDTAQQLCFMKVSDTMQ